MRPGGPEQIAARGVQHALGLTRRAGGVEDEQRILGVYRFGRAVGVNLGGFQAVIEVAPLDHRHVRAGATDDQDRVDLHLRQGLVDIGLQRNVLAAAQTFVGCDDQVGTAVLDPAAQAVGRKAAEDDRMHRADPRTGQHGVGGLGDHGQIQGDPVALFGPMRLQHIGHAAHLGVQFAEGDVAAVGGIVAFPDDRRLVLAVGQVTVDAIGRDVQDAILKPANAEIFLVEGNVLDPGRRGDPVQTLGLFGPEGVGRLARGDPRRLIRLPVHMGLFGPVGGDGIEGGIRHARRLRHQIRIRIWRTGSNGSCRRWRRFRSRGLRTSARPRHQTP